jgi:HK97 family phage major capsid protein
MANSLTELEYLSNDTLKTGIAKTIITESPFARYMPWITVQGNSYKYNMETVEAAAQFYSVNEQWQENTPEWEQRTADITILGGDADTDKFIQDTRKDQDINAAIIELKAKAIARKLEAHAILGRTTALGTYSTAKSFKGLALLLAECETSSTTDLDGLNNTQVYACHATSAVLTLDMMDELKSRVKPSENVLFIMNTQHRNKLASLARAAGNNLTVADGKLGMPVEYWGTNPILICDHIPNNIQDGSSSVLAIASYDNTARASGYDNSLIFAVRFDEVDGLCGLLGGNMMEIEHFDKLETKHALRDRIYLYPGMALFNKLAAAVMINVQYAAA